MANSFFDFDASLKEGLGLRKGASILPDDDDDDCYDNEEEYDALNDETFGACDPSDDWEQQHEQFAEFQESSKHSEHIENSISQLVLNDSSSDDEKSIEPLSFPSNSSVWAYTPTHKNGDIFNSTSVLSSLQKASKSFIESHTDNASLLNVNNALPGKICTVEELEKNLLKNSQTANVYRQSPQHVQQAQFQQPRPMLPMPQHPPPYHPMLQHPNARLPPPMNMPPPGMRHLPPHPLMGTALRMIPPHLPPHPHMMPPNGTPRPPGFLYPLPVNHRFGFPPPPYNPGPVGPNQSKGVPPRGPYPNNMQVMQPPPQQQPPQQQFSPQRQQQHRVRQDSGNFRGNFREQEGYNRDEYAGLMTAKDKQWLLNIQLLQLNTGTPYFDDYYYTIYKERQSRSNKENNQHYNERERNGRFQNNSGRQRRNSDRQENTLTPRVYTPLQFENSLGKLQCGSVTAPRKIIDMDIVTPEKDQDLPQPTKDSRKTKQLLLELEALYSLLLKAEDIKNPMFISNMEKWREMKQKQRLRELEQAPTPEQKQEVLRLFKLESEPVEEHQYDYIVKIVNGWLQDEKFASFLNIRKGKILLLRLLPHLNCDAFSTHLVEIWSKVLLSLPIIGRRDTAGDNILPRFYPYFKRYVQNCTFSDVLDIVAGLVEVVKQENSRSTPLSHVGKAPLYFVILNKFGVSALVVLFMRCEYLFSTDTVTERQQADWSAFLASWAKHTDTVSKVAVPIEVIPSQVFAKHVNRFSDLTLDKKSLLKKYFVDIPVAD